MSDSHDVTAEDRLARCEQAIGYTFTDRELLARCLTHSSAARTRLLSNERLEFLGDAILGAIVCELLYNGYPEFPEGELTRVKSIVVSRETCALIAEQLGLEQFLLLGKGLTSNGSVPSSISAAAFEALIGGVYLDGGFDAARQMIATHVGPEILIAVNAGHGKNYKSLLQQLSQKMFGETPVYRLLDEKGPDHSKCFKIAAIIGTTAYPAAWGPSKKSAEQHAAHNALDDLQGHRSPHPAE